MSEEVNDTSIVTPEDPTEPVPVVPKTAADYQKELADQGALIADLTRKMRDTEGRAKTSAFQVSEVILAMSQDVLLRENPLVLELLMNWKRQGDLQTQVNDYAANIEAQTTKLKVLAAEAAPVVLPTLKDKTLLRNGDNKAVITVAEKLKEDAWNPVQAFIFADKEAATKKFIIRTVDEDAFKKAARAGTITPGEGIYAWHFDYEVRIMKDGLTAL